MWKKRLITIIGIPALLFSCLAAYNIMTLNSLTWLGIATSWVLVAGAVLAAVVAEIRNSRLLRAASFVPLLVLLAFLIALSFKEPIPDSGLLIDSSDAWRRSEAARSRGSAPDRIP